MSIDDIIEVNEDIIWMKSKLRNKEEHKYFYGRLGKYLKDLNLGIYSVHEAHNCAYEDYVQKYRRGSYK